MISLMITLVSLLPPSPSLISMLLRSHLFPLLFLSLLQPSSCPTGQPLSQLYDSLDLLDSPLHVGPFSPVHGHLTNPHHSHRFGHHLSPLAYPYCVHPLSQLPQPPSQPSIQDSLQPSSQSAPKLAHQNPPSTLHTTLITSILSSVQPAIQPRPAI